MSHGSLIDLTPSFHHFKPSHISYTLAGFGDRILNRIFNRFCGTSDQFDLFVDMITHAINLTYSSYVTKLDHRLKCVHLDLNIHLRCDTSHRFE